jgi:hypothetical protein
MTDFVDERVYVDVECYCAGRPAANLVMCTAEPSLKARHYHSPATGSHWAAGCMTKPLVTFPNAGNAGGVQGQHVTLLE